MNLGDNLFFRNRLETGQVRARIEPRPEDERDLRGHYFRDTTAIVHSYPFRRMKHKTQVFFAPKNDHICTRIEHVMHVATIAATICRALGLDVDLAWAIGVGHDLGHTPFGHLGETILARIRGVHGFRHEIYGLRVVDHLANRGRGLNLTYAVRDGIINHCGEKFEQSLTPDFTVKDLSAITRRDRLPSTWEGVVVRMSDKIAYLGRDLEDALQLSLVTIADVPDSAARVLGRTNSDIIDTLVNDVIETSLETGEIGFSDRIYRAFLEMKEFNYARIYTSRALEQYHQHFERILETLYAYLMDLFQRCGNDRGAYEREQNALATRFGDYVAKMEQCYITVDGNLDAAVFDYLAGMTDDFAIDSVNEIMVPRQFNVQFEAMELARPSTWDTSPL